MTPPDAVTPPEEVAGDEQVQRDVQRLHELGYRQELRRGWSGFTNFAISFTIISVLAGPFTNFSFAWYHGGPIGVTYGWPILLVGVMAVVFSMSELTSKYPTAGGPYWWAHDLGGKGWSWMTGWFNIIGLIGIVAGVGYGVTLFLSPLLGLYGVNILGVDFTDTKHVLTEQFGLFVIILALYTLVNIFADRLLGMINNISVWWHVLGILTVVGLLVFVPDHHQSAHFVLTDRINLSSVKGGATGGLGFFLLVLPVGFTVTMYTMTGYDASAHTAEETRGAAVTAARGLWQAAFYSGIAGYIVLLAFLFAATDVNSVNDSFGFVGTIFTTALDPWAAKLVFIIAVIAQLFCGAAGLTSASRTWYAFSRDRAIPGWYLFRRVNRDRVPFNAVIAVSLFALLITIPALWGKNNFAFAFFAITGICTVGLYIAYIIPVYLRLRKGDDFEPGPWTLGRKYKWVNVIGIIFVVLVVYALDIPYEAIGLPWNSGFDATTVNYTPVAILLPLIFGVWYLVSAKNKYQGPVKTLEEDVVTRD